MDNEEILEEQGAEEPTNGSNETPNDSPNETPSEAPDETPSETPSETPNTASGDQDEPTSSDESDNEESSDTTDDSDLEPVDLVRLLGITEIPISIPIEFLFVYNKLLLVMIELGESMLLDCKSLCNSKNMPVIECYHMFKAALAAKQLAYASTTEGETTVNYYNKLANTLLNYTKEQLNCITRNYSDDLSFTLPLGANGLVNLFITKNDINTEIIVQGSDVDIAEAILGVIRNVLQGAVVTVDSEETYDLTQEELEAQQHWHVLEGYEFIPDSSEVYINGTKYFKDSPTADYRYEEWIIEDDGIRKGVGIKVLHEHFDTDNQNYEHPDEIHVEAKLFPSNNNSN